MDENSPYFAPAAIWDRSRDLLLSLCGVPSGANAPTRSVTEAAIKLPNKNQSTDQTNLRLVGERLDGDAGAGRCRAGAGRAGDRERAG